MGARQVQRMKQENPLGLFKKTWAYLAGFQDGSQYSVPDILKDNEPSIRLNPESGAQR